MAAPDGTAPIDASSGGHVSHCLSDAGNRQTNRVLHIMATAQLCNPSVGHDHHDHRPTQAGLRSRVC
ncbi:transposase [Actinotalea sp. M2MS4P-6]|uniref:transposase n=1 Tax=Actinotalea sp. M2MS4P-6 TaxID=2983762 RepID=UPI0021E360D6|nr:transposase [Actinotalea sp. M2MS4P-6]MCV2395349.1 transposase [Actinotalea sp. M2MS4P-6]